MENENFLHKIISAFRRHWLPAVLVFAAVVCIGLAYSFLRTPTYTATATAIYSARDISPDASASSHVNVSNGYLDTVADFIDEQNVLARADYYYALYSEKDKSEDYTVADFAKEILAAAEREYSYSELGELIGKPAYVFVKQTEYNSFNQKDTVINYVYSGKITAVGENEITLEKDGVTFTVDKSTPETETGTTKTKTEFLHAAAALPYRSEYEYGDLEGAEGMQIKVVLLKDGAKTVRTGVLHSYGADRIVLKSGDNEIGVAETHFVAAYPYYPKNIVNDCVSVKHTPAKSSDKDFTMNVCYDDPDPSDAKVKANLTMLAAYLEAGVIKEPAAGERAELSYRYFPQAKISLTDMGSLTPVIDMSKTKIMLIFAVIGVLASAAAVYLAATLDRTVKSKDVLEELTGASVLATIEKTEGE